MIKEKAERNPFSVPQGYFDELPMTIQNRCNTHQTKVSWISIGSRIKYATSLGVIAIAAFGLFVTNTNQNNNSNAYNHIQEQVPYITFRTGNDPLGSLIKNVTLPRIENTTSQRYTKTDNLVDILSVENVNLDDILSAGFY